MDAVNSDGNTAAHLAFKFGNNELGECVPSFLFLPSSRCILISGFLNFFSQVSAFQGRK